MESEIGLDEEVIGAQKLEDGIFLGDFIAAEVHS